MNKRIKTTLSLFIGLLLMLSVSIASGQDAKTKAKARATEDVTQNAKLWEHVNIPERDLYNGSGGQEMQPDASG